MKTGILVRIAATFFILPFAFVAGAATTIDAVNRYAYGANVGWMDWRGDFTNGAIIGEYVCSGYIYSANCGWINLGAGAPTNGIYYQNLSSNDFGVNQDGFGNLRGYAWGANIGWILFENTGAPKVNMATGDFSGYAYSANCGWISLTNASAVVQTDSIRQGALAPDGLPIAWLLQNFGTTNVEANSDPTDKGMTVGQDYVAGTNPNNSNSVFQITYVAHDASQNTTLDWDSVPTRAYAVQSRTPLSSGTWVDLSVMGLGADTLMFFDSSTNGTDFYRVRAFRPLGP